MSSTEKSFFSEVGIRSDRERVFAALTESSIIIQMQSQGLSGDADREIRMFRGIRLKDASLVVEPVATEGQIWDGPVVVSFQIGQEKYFIKSRLFTEGGRRFLDLAPKLFKLQRRDNYRLPFPPEFGARLLVTGLESIKLNLNLELVNLSGGGCAVDIHSNSGIELSKDQILSGELRVRDRLSLQVKGIVRHARPFGSRGSGIFRVGIEFLEISDAQRESVIKIVMDLHRELFSRFKFA